MAGQRIELTHEQYARLEKFDPDVRVVGYDRGCPLVRHPSGRVVRIDISGRVIAATRAVVIELADRAAYP